MQAPHRKQNHVPLAVRRRCQLLMHRATKGRFFFCFFVAPTLCHKLSQCAKTGGKRGSESLWCLSEVDTTQQLTSLFLHAEKERFQKETTCSFSNKTILSICYTSFYGAQMKYALSTCFTDTYWEVAVKLFHMLYINTNCISLYHRACHRSHREDIFYPDWYFHTNYATTERQDFSMW